MGKKRRPLPNGHHALRREAEEAARPDRLYPIRSEKYYCFYAGHVPGKRQALVAGDLDLLIAFFEHQGNLLEVQRRTLPPSVKVPEMNCGTLDDRDFQEYLKGKEALLTLLPLLTDDWQVAFLGEKEVDGKADRKSVV